MIRRLLGPHDHAAAREPPRRLRDVSNVDCVLFVACEPAFALALDRAQVTKVATNARYASRSARSIRRRNECAAWVAYARRRC